MEESSSNKVTTIQKKKRNTDCVYFLASPLTCKKGMECEYRHNEMARLNPTACWFWLSSNCLNPCCSFRHPPLDIHVDVPPESSSSSSTLPIKTNVPCYFFYNGFCNKGGRCSFMHGPDGTTLTGKSGNSSTTVKENVPSNGKISVTNDTMSEPAELQANQSEADVEAVMDLKMKPKEDFRCPSPKKIAVRRTPPQIAASQSEEAVIVKPAFVLHVDSFNESASQDDMIQSSEDKVDVDDHAEPQGQWESSPEKMGCEDDQECFPPFDTEQQNLENFLFGYDFENPVEYDPAYHDVEENYEGRNNGYTDYADTMQIFGDIGNGFGISRNPMSNSLISRKRNFVTMELPANGRRDLRDQLGRRGLIEGHPATWSSRRHNPSYLLGQIHGKSQWRFNDQHLKNVLASEVVYPSQRNGSLLNVTYRHRHGEHRLVFSERSRKQQKEKWLPRKHFLSSEVVRRPILRKKKFSQESLQFTRPKTLAEIKEEKKVAEENGNHTGKIINASRMAVADFESPKSLSEILKDKRRSCSS